ncbi:MAG: DNA-binding response regulator [Chloroflexi bacterium]|nr:MAG: DNA-binding response regulator [Chloroflexota bacterium]
MTTHQQQTILVVDDEKTIREVVRKYLERENFRVVEATSGTQVLDYLHQTEPDLIVLDIMLPGVDGFEITRSLRNGEDDGFLSIGNDIPIIMLTARTGELDRIFGFELGADDYVVKPFSPRELVMRVKAVLRRHQPIAATQVMERADFPHFSIEFGSRSVTVGDATITLPAKEFELLSFMVKNPRQVFSRAQLLDHVWGYDYYGDDSTVTVHICRLRDKLEPDPSKPRYFQTVWGAGYKFESHDDD